ncbi:hypothetical protein [Ornithinimicrobium murale]|uniref:hypothetical protein n=1 Tax=Ornithinimicrobium murale TaxID=1050153 RepID=UPI000E0D2EB1|nr:hypothetical protein [Ornithinimicrobium murale]
MALDYTDEHIDISSYDGAWFSTHFYAEVDTVAVHRVLTEGDAGRMNRQKQRTAGTAGFRAGDTTHSFDTQDDALAAARAVLADDTRHGHDQSWPRHLVRRVDGQWVPTSADEWLDEVP